MTIQDDNTSRNFRKPILFYYKIICVNLRKSAFQKIILVTHEKLCASVSLCSISSLFVLKQQFHDLACRFCDRCARSEDCHYACLIEEVVILRGDDSSGEYEDIVASHLLQLGDDLRDEGFVSCRER